MNDLGSKIILVACFPACLGILAEAQIATLGTAQTIVRVKNGTTAPKLLTLQSSGKAVWSDKAVEELIATAVLGGQTVPPKWRLVARAEHWDAKRVFFTYETRLPHLRLTWEWSAPAAKSPLEHHIWIGNLDTQELWLPLQHSFRYEWSVLPTEQLKQIYIDKGAGKPSVIGTHEVKVAPGYSWEGRSSTYASDEEPREIIP